MVMNKFSLKKYSRISDFKQASHSKEFRISWWMWFKTTAAGGRNWEEHQRIISGVTLLQIFIFSFLISIPSFFAIYYWWYGIFRKAWCFPDKKYPHATDIKFLFFSNTPGDKPLKNLVLCCYYNWMYPDYNSLFSIMFQIIPSCKKHIQG